MTNTQSGFGALIYTNELMDLTRSSDYAHFFHRESGVIRSSRDLNEFIDHYRTHGPEKCYIYTGRGPSSSDMHLGHMVPFMVTRELQRSLGTRVVIQLTDDEKFLFRGEFCLEDYQRFARHNKDLILKCGLDPELTDIYIDTEDIARFYPTMLKIQNKINFNQVHAVFGLSESDSIGKIAFPALEMAPCNPVCLFPESQSQNMRCLVICAWDQDPFFRLVRDYAKSLKFSKPSILHLNYLPALNGEGKMCTTGDLARFTIWLSDSPESVKNKIKRYAFSGGGATAELQRAHGANTDVDVACKYLTMFMKDREQLQDIINSYRTGTMNTSQLKSYAINTVDQILKVFREEYDAG